MNNHLDLCTNHGSPDAREPAILLSSYGTGANHGKNLGVPGYSHDIVMQLYAPLLEKWGKVILVENPNDHLESAIVQAREQGLDPIHLSVIPCHDAYLSPNVPNVLMPAWEFPDIPNHPFAFNPRNDWTFVANQCDALLVSGPFTSNAFRKAGTTVPIHFVQVPTPETYFAITDWQYETQATIDCSAYTLSCDDNKPPIIKIPEVRKPAKGLKRIGKRVEMVVRKTSKKLLGLKFYERLSLRVGRLSGKNSPLPKPNLDRVELSGVVYTSIFNPNDGRKNWQDLLTAFLFALGDKEDATLVVKLVTRNPIAVAKFMRYYAGRDIKHRCKVIVISEYLTEEQLCELAAASTYYIQTTKAEGNCLPLMNYLAAGRPGISPSHSAISDYFDEEIGWVAESHPEPAAWPHDPRLRIRSTWARLVWPSMVEQIKKSYEVAKSDPRIYHQLSQNARARLKGWASCESVQQRLLSALDHVREQNVKSSQASMERRRTA